MKLMPEQPTEEMLNAGHDAGGYEDEDEWGWAPPDLTYKAMYAAAPNIEHEEIAKLKREKEMLVEARIAELEKDARRYQWLKTQNQLHFLHPNSDFIWTCDMESTELDEAIDGEIDGTNE